MTLLKFAAERDNKLYRLRCAFTVDADMPFEKVEKVSRLAGEAFIRDMGLQGFALHDGRLHLDPAPRHHIEAVSLPTLREIERMEERVVGAVVKDVGIDHGVVDYRMWGLFAHREIITQRKEDL